MKTPEMPHQYAMMRNEIEWVDAAKAAAWLGVNENVRAVQGGWVEYFAMLLRRGEFVPTPDGLMFGLRGNLHNGQHRLAAIVKTGIGAWMFVARQVPPEVVAATDQGRRRRACDVAGVDKRIMEPLTEAARIVLGQRQLPPTVTLDLLHTPLGHAAEALIEYCGTTAKVFSAAPVKLAACARLAAGERMDYVLPTYASLVHFDVAAAPPVASTFIYQVHRGTAGSTGGDRLDLMARALVVFDEKSRNLTRIQIGDEQKTRASKFVKEVAARYMTKEKAA